jgi:hypothetical protein
MSMPWRLLRGEQVDLGEPVQRGQCVVATQRASRPAASWPRPPVQTEADGGKVARLLADPVEML